MSGASSTGRRGRPPEPWRAERILSAARRLFYERGFHGVSVDEIGRAAGTTGTALYRHFGGKQDLLITLLNDVQARYLAEMPPPRDDPRQELSELLAYQLAMVAANRELAGVWTQQHHVLDDARLADYAAGERAYFERWTDCLARCCPGLGREECAEVGRAVIEMTNFLAASPTHEAQERELELVRRVLDAGLAALADRGVAGRAAQDLPLG